MMDRRILWHFTLLFLTFVATFLFWQLLCLMVPYSSNTSFPDVPVYELHTDHYNYTYPLQLLKTNDYNSLVNYSFNFDILNLGCNFKTLLLILVHSSPNNFKKRSVIRSTWGEKSDDVQLFFVMGKSNTSDSQRLIENESRIHKDIIQGNFKDTYRNLTYKHIVSLKYAIYHCPQAKYILKTDDDVFVNMPLLLNFLTFDLSPFGVSKALICSVKKETRVLRSYRSKWRVAFEEYPLRTYPPYCPGWVILYSPDVVFSLYKSAQNTSNVFWIDDVHITGTLAEKNNITHTDIKRFVITQDDQTSLVNDKVFPTTPFLFGRYDLQEEEIKALWTSVMSHRVPKSILVRA